MTQVYFLLYDEKKSFIICQKLKKGYFFKNSKGPVPPGYIYPDGFPIENAPGLPALPGGGMKGSDAQAAGYAEWLEETNDALNFKYITVTLDKQAGYTAVWARASSDFVASAYQSVVGNLKTAAMAALAIQSGEYGKGDYAKLMRDFDTCPADNELDVAFLMNVNVDGDWKIIKSWEGNKEIGWYYDILLRLKQAK